LGGAAAAALGADFCGTKGFAPPPDAGVVAPLAANRVEGKFGDRAGSSADEDQPIAGKLATGWLGETALRLGR
jgi:hypothetical protein